MSASEPETANVPISKSMPTDLCLTHNTRSDSKVFAPGESGVWGGVLNYANVILGSGIVGIPYASK